MPPTNTTDPLGRQLEIYEESWKTDHEEVKRVLWRFEDKLSVGLALFQAIRDRYWTWRERVIVGAELYDPEEEQEVKGRFAWWLRPCREVMKQLEHIEATYGPVEGGNLFRRSCREAQQILETWTRPEAATQEATASYELEGVPTHTDRALTLEEMAGELGRVSQSSEHQSVPLKHGIDYSKAF